MPTISTYSPSTKVNINQGIQQASIDTSGAGVIAKAVGNIGQQGANLANQMLMRKKVEQADSFAQDWTTKKNIERERKHRQLQTELEANPELDYLGEMAKWEEDRSKEIIGQAPTDLARTAFTNVDTPYRNKNLIGSELYITDFYRTRSKVKDQEANDAEAKRIQGLDADFLASSGSDLISETEFALNETNKRSMRQIELGYMDSNEGRKFGKNEGNKIAIAGLRSTFTNDKLQESAKMLDFEKMLLKDEAVQAEVRAMVEDATGRKIGEVLADGTVLMAKTEEGDIISYDTEKGTTLNLEQINIYADTKKKVLDKLEDNNILRHLTQEQQQWGINTLLQKLKQKNKESRLAFNNRSQGMWALLSSDDPNSLRYNPSEPDMAGTTQVNEMISQAKGVFANDPEGYADWASKTATAVQLGKYKDSTVWDDETTSTKKKDRLLKETMKTLEDMGLSEMKDDPLFVAKFTEQAKAELESHNAKRLQESIRPEYVYKNDGYARKTFDKYLSQENSNPAMAAQTLGKLKEVVSSRQDSLGIPRGYQNVWPESYLIDTANRLNSLINPETGYGGKQELTAEFNKHELSKGDDYYRFMKSMKKLDPELINMFFLPKTSEGIHAQSLMYDVVSNYKNIRGNFVTSTGMKESDISMFSYKRLQPYISYLRNTTNTSEKESQISTWMKVLNGRTMQLAGRGKSLTEASDRAFTDLFTANFHQQNYGSDNNVFFKSELAKAGLTTDMADASIRYLSDPDNISKIAPTAELYKYVPNFVAIGKTPAEKNIAVKEAFRSKGVRLRPIPDGDRIIFRVQDKNNFWSEPLMDKNKNPISIPFKDLKGMQGIVEESKKTYFFGVGF